MTVGELADLHHNILNVRTPPVESARLRTNGNSQRTYRKDFETPPLNGGLEPRRRRRIGGHCANGGDIPDSYATHFHGERGGGGGLTRPELRGSGWLFGLAG